jgi:hypothetical protein
MNFREWLLENSGEQIAIDLSGYAAAMNREIEKLIDHQKQRRADMASLDVPGHTQFVQQNTPQDYPHRQQLMQALQSGDVNSAVAQYARWSTQQSHSSDNYEIFRRLRDLQDYHDRDNDINEDEMRQWGQQLIQESQQNMEQISNMLQRAIQGIKEWHGTPIIIEAQTSTEGYNDISLSPSTYAGIIMGKQGDVYAHFTLFPTEDLQGVEDIGDTIEGGWGEEDFFATPEVKEDYYNLINELKNPGSTQQGKVLTLYTSRPAKDHDFFASTTYLPINMFLSNSADHVSGMGVDYGVDAEIWKVRIDSKYLTQTLDGPIKYYMVTKDKAPVVSISPY